MRRIPKTWMPLVLTLITVIVTSPGAAAPPGEADIGKEVKVDGVVIAREGENFTVQDLQGEQTEVRITAATRIVEKKKNFLRDPLYFSSLDIQRGLQVEVKGTVAPSGLVVARKVKFTKHDLEVARVIDSNLMQMDDQMDALADESGYLAGQLGEVGELTQENRRAADTAQKTADQALNEVRGVDSRLSGVEWRVDSLGESLSQLDEYDVRDEFALTFKAGSSLLDDGAKQELDNLAASVRESDGLIIEVRGFASSDGSEEFNRKLSQRRAESVVNYLVLHHQLEPRSFVIPYGYGELNPVADNSDPDGRRQNRRVEVRLLANKGLSSFARASSTP